jgi:phosphoribosylaminoimidazolecarboxamide formyltransferase/IMP cyclohydrolase
MQRPNRILMSVSDKRGLEEWKALTDIGWEIITTGGTAKTLKGLEIPFTPVEEKTKMKELMEGRIKTLHPILAGGVLADRSKEEHMLSIIEHNLCLIDLVVINFYPFEKSPEIENIDIGGPTFVRAAVKNGRWVIPICNPEDYARVIDEILKTGRVSIETREELVEKAIEYTSRYDKAIHEWLREQRLLGRPIFEETAAWQPSEA